MNALCLRRPHPVLPMDRMGPGSGINSVYKRRTV